MKTTAIITAGGSGKRFMSDIPKQYHLLDGIPIIVRTLQQFSKSPLITDIVVSAAPQYIQVIEKYLLDYNLQKVKEIVPSGVERQDSVYNAIESETAFKSDIIMIHDAVRPFVSQKLLQELVEATIKYGAVFPGLKPKETIKLLADDNTVNKTLNRNRLIAVQTPESFKKEVILRAFDYANQSGFVGTDCTSLVEKIGIIVHTVPGEENNIKITTLMDFIIAKSILENL